MKRNFLKFIATPLMMGGFALSVPAMAANTSVFTLEDDVPPEAVAAAKAAAPGVVFDMVTIEIEDGEVTLELSGTDEAGNVVEVDVATSSGWSVEEVETVIDLEEVPAVVMAALEAELPGYQPEKIERSDRPEGVTVYEFEGSNAEGALVVVEISADGQDLIYDKSDMS